MNRLMTAFVVAFLMFAVAPAWAQNKASGFFDDAGVTIKLGTPGVGLEMTKGLKDTLNARLGFNVFSYKMSDSGEEEMGEDGKPKKATEVSAKLSLFTVPLLLDWHPWKNPVRFSTGLIFNNNKIDLSAVPGESIGLGEDEEEVDFLVSSLSGDVSFSPLVPYLGLGWGNAAEKKNGPWHFAFDLGVMFQGKPDISLHAVSADNRQAELDAAVEKEMDKIEDDFSAFTIYPVLSAGVSYTF